MVFVENQESSAWKFSFHSQTKRVTLSPITAAINEPIIKMEMRKNPCEAKIRRWKASCHPEKADKQAWFGKNN